MNVPVFLLGFMLVSTSATAQETRVETQAIRCGTLTFIHSSLAKASPAFGTAMQASTHFYGSLYSASRFVRSGVDTTDVQIQARQSELLDEFRKLWKSNPESVVLEVALCNTWRAQFAPQMVKLNEDSTPKDLVLAVGTPPKRAAAEQVAKWRPLANQAFEAWLGAAPVSERPPKQRY